MTTQQPNEIEWIRPDLNPVSADYPGEYVAAREYERMLRDLREYAEKVERKAQRRHGLASDLAGALRLYLASEGEHVSPHDQEQAYKATQAALRRYDESAP